MFTLKKAILLKNILRIAVLLKILCPELGIKNSTSKINPLIFEDRLENLCILIR